MSSLPSSSTKLTFEQLVQKERAWLDSRPAPSGAMPPADLSSPGLYVSRPGVAGEPWVCFTARDHFGIALSGGGIRSATFNLGLLQSLDQKGLLEHADYLSTVSGGGYAGGFLTAWHHQRAAAPTLPLTPNAFPKQEGQANDTPGSPAETREPPEIRHLREFSRFLMPRLGVFHMETWSAIVTILGGFIPALCAGCAVLALLACAWVLFATQVSTISAAESARDFAILSLLALASGEYGNFIRGRAKGRGLVWFALLALASALLTQAVFRLTLDDSGVAYSWLSEKFSWLHGALADFRAFDWLLTWNGAGQFAAALSPAAAWALVILLLITLRAGTSRIVAPAWASSLDRVLAIYMGLALGWTALAAVWEFSLWLANAFELSSASTGIGASAVATGGLFAWLRDWLTKPSEETRAGTLLQKIVGVIRPMIPQILAIVAVVLLFTGVSLGVQAAIEHARLGLALKIILTVILTTLLLFNPARVGMHDFYRSRICRCFLGAARANSADYRRQTAENPTDDITFGELAERPPLTRHPYHLVCCTANNLSGDILGNLYRGARSAVLSRYGVALGDSAAPLDKVRLSSALTASAAAFNSQMGRLSMDFGPAVAFLMSAMNLRLGLWVPHPLSSFRRYFLFPGLPFFYEMFGLTNCDPDPAVARPAAPAPSAADAATALAVKANQWARDLHLSDGGHFENLALYELVRRHCRYIVVSDCGADPEVVFDDLAVALRTIREDFGVEIELDVNPLRPDASGQSRQHAVVGTIHYDGLNGLDKGTLVYFKPTLTGDEPSDVVQYRSRNLAFPHESTGDQFYDEAQWESYRRLALHAGNVVFRFLDDSIGPPTGRRARRSFLENAFLEASRNWHPAPERQNEVFLALTERCTQLENNIRENAPVALRAEFFPEAAAVGAAPAPSPSNGDEVLTLYFLMQVAQMMEDVWIGADLERYWSHPLNDGWMNYCHRWASTPSFRRWWPVLRPTYSIGFRDFVRERFNLGYDDAVPPHGSGGRLQIATTSAQQGLVWEYWLRNGRARPGPNQQVLEFELTLDPLATTSGATSLRVGLLIYEQSSNGAICWKSDHLFVPPSLTGAGITARFLEAVIDRLAVNRTRRLEVTLDAGSSGTNPAKRLKLLQELNFYKSRGFVAETPAHATGKMLLVLPPAATAPTRPVLPMPPEPHWQTWKLLTSLTKFVGMSGGPPKPTRNTEPRDANPADTTSKPES